MRYLKTNTATIVTVGPFYDKTDGVTIEGSLTITNERISFVVDNNDGSAPTLVLDNVTGATSGTSNDLNYITNCDAGLMQLELAAANVNYLGRAFLTITDAANHCPVFHEFMILPAVIFDAMIAGTDLFDVSAVQVLGTALTETSGGYLAAGIKKLFDVASPVLTAASVNQTGDAFARLGAPVGASISADIAAIEAQTDDIGAAGAGLSAVPWNAAWDAEVQSEVADALAVYDPPTNAEMEARTLVASSYFDPAADAVASVTSAGLSAAAVDAILDEAVEGTLTLRQVLRLLLAKAANKVSGGGTTSISFRDLGDAKNRIVMTVDVDGNRSAVTLDGS